MIKIELTKRMLEAASERAAKLPVFNRSHRGVAANEVGCIGEILFEYVLYKNNISYHNETSKTTHDYCLSNGKTVDVKTKDRTVAPLPYYDCSVPLYNHPHQCPDYYVFISLLRDKQKDGIERFTHGYILGVATRKLIHEKGKIWRAGEVDEANGTKFWTSCINIKIENLLPFGE